LNGLTEAPVVFPAFAVGETPAPERSEGERGGGKTPPWAEVLSEKKYPLPVNGLHSGPRVHRIFTLAL